MDDRIQVTGGERRMDDGRWMMDNGHFTVASESYKAQAGLKFIMKSSMALNGSFCLQEPPGTRMPVHEPQSMVEQWLHGTHQECS